MIIAVIKDSMLLLNISFGARAWVCLGPCIEFMFLCCLVSFQAWFGTVKCFCDVLILVPEFVLQGITIVESQTWWSIRGRPSLTSHDLVGEGVKG